MPRYIDAEYIEYEPMLSPRGNGMYDEREVAYKDEIDDIPTADVRENVKGKWVRIKDTVQCSQCKAKWIDHTYLIETFRFCPNCGADMRGEA